MCEQMARRRLDRSTRPPLYMSLGPFGLLRCLQISFLLALLIFVFKELAPNGLAQMYPRLSVELLIEANDSATPTRDVHPYLFTTRTDLPTQGSLHQPENSPAPLIDVNPFKVQDEDPPSEEFAPVFIEEALMKRKDLRICELDKWNWTVADPDKAIFYFVCCGPIERFLELPRRTPERPYLCYDCDAKLQMGSLAQDDCLLRQKCRLAAKVMFLMLHVQVSVPATRLEAIATRLEAMTSRLEAMASGLEAMASGLEAMASRLEAMASRLEAMASRLEAMASRLEAMASRLEAIASRLEAIAIRHTAKER